MKLNDRSILISFNLVWMISTKFVDGIHLISTYILDDSITTGIFIYLASKNLRSHLKNKTKSV